jgi:hypothetical protein
MDENLKKKLIEDFNLTNMEGSKQEEMIDMIGTMLFESVIERSLDRMDEKTMTDFENAISGVESDYEKVASFLRERVEGFNEIVADEMSRLKRSTSLFA